MDNFCHVDCPTLKTQSYEEANKCTKAPVVTEPINGCKLMISANFILCLDLKANKMARLTLQQGFRPFPDGLQIWCRDQVSMHEKLVFCMGKSLFSVDQTVIK